MISNRLEAAHGAALKRGPGKESAGLPNRLRILLNSRCRHICFVDASRSGKGRSGASQFAGLWGRCGMRHIMVATTMLVVALVVTFAAASVLQGVAVASGRTNNEPYVVVEAVKSVPMKAV